MSRADEAAVLAFAKGLPTQDLLFLPRNISEPKVLSAWINEIERGGIRACSRCRTARWSLRHPGAQPAFLVAACRRDKDGGLARRARAGGWPSLSQETFTLAWARAGKSCRSR